MSKTVITHPDGTTTIIRKAGFAGGCFTWFVVLFVLAAPAAYFGPWALAAYLFLAVIAGLVMFGLSAEAAPRATPGSALATARLTPTAPTPRAPSQGSSCLLASNGTRKTS